MRKQTLLLFLIGAPVAFLLGCSDTTNNANLPPPQAGQESTLKQQIADIDNNPNMPPQAKEAAKASIMQHQNMNLNPGKK
ncbi:MAG TPA: hypothetical protein VKU00_03705 [Chthonomonadaceae bacterium]|nr:hypothetical protein [Chthonomonadaceae bacterium]